MQGLLRPVTDLPIVFGLLITFAVFLFAIASFMLGMAVPAGKYKPLTGQILGRLLSTLFFLFILARFNWLTAAGFTRTAGWQSWLAVILFLVYASIAAVYAYFGDLKFDLSQPKLAGVVALDQMMIGLVEECAYRGLILYAFVRLWGDSTWGLAASVLLSAVFFGASHLVWMAFGKPRMQTILMSLSAFNAGIFYAAFVLASGSIWPAVIFHGVVNAIVNIRVIAAPEYKESVSSGVRMVLLDIPMVIYAVYLIWMTPPFAIIPSAP